MTVFQSARWKLTFWYALIIFLVSVFFSLAFYRLSTRELDRLIDRVKFEQGRENEGFAPPRRVYLPSIKELEDSKEQLLLALVVIDGAILIFSGAAAYFLAGRTLGPIKEMIDEQNQFISSSSHELRTPIATMRAEMEGGLLEKNISDENARKLISSNLEDLGKLQTLTNRLLELAQIHDVKRENYRGKIPLLEIVTTAQKQVAALARAKQIKIITEVKECQILGDRDSLTEVLVIILDNAIKYSPKKSKINIKSLTAERKVRIMISDQGVGIAKEDLPHIFEKFYRASKSRSEDGFGLGLAIAKETVVSHGGAIKAESLTGKGTTILLELPLFS